jgi:hypothetical protein
MPGENTSRETGASGSASAPSGETWRLSIAKPLTSKVMEPFTDKSIRARGLFANRHVGATPTQPFGPISNVVVPGNAPAW